MRRWGSYSRRCVWTGGAVALTVTLLVWVVGRQGPTLLTGRSDNPRWTAIGTLDSVTWACFCERGALLRQERPYQHFWSPTEVRGPLHHPMIAIGPEGIGVASFDIHRIAMRSWGVLPYWAAFLILWLPSAVLALAAFGLAAAAKRVVRVRVFRRRIEAACCGVCGYDLTGNISGRCPECGEAAPEQEMVERRE